MNNDEKEIRQRYSGMTMDQLVKLQQNSRLPAVDEKIVDEILEFRGVSKDVRQKLKNSTSSTSSAPVKTINTNFKETAANPAQTYTISKEIVSRPLLVSLIALLGLWRFISYIWSALGSHSILAISYFLSLSVLSIFLAYGLWGLRPWARKFMISYCGLIVLMSWLIILLLFFSTDGYWRLSLEEISRSVGHLGATEVMKAFMYKVLFIKACILSIVYGALTAYFFRTNIRQLFE